MASLPPGPVDEAPGRAPSMAELLRPVAVVALVAGAMWVEEVVDLLPHTPFDSWGIRPRQLRGLPGVALAPFLHDGFGHLLSNTVPFVVLGCIVAASGVQRFVQVAVIVAAIAGLGTWLTGPSRTIHIGASGVVFGFVLSLIACYKGYNTSNGAEGVGRSTTQAVVAGSVTVLILNYFLATWLLQIFPN